MEPGFYMAYWYPDAKGATFAFERDLHGVFKDEAEALYVHDQLKLVGHRHRSREDKLNENLYHGMAGFG